MDQGCGIEWTESTWNPITGCEKVGLFGVMLRAILVVEVKAVEWLFPVDEAQVIT